MWIKSLPGTSASQGGSRVEGRSDTTQRAFTPRRENSAKICYFMIQGRKEAGGEVEPRQTENDDQRLLIGGPDGMPTQRARIY